MNEHDGQETPTRQEGSLADTPVALVGLGGLFPRSRDLRQFWGNVVEAADCMEDVPESHWRIADHYDPDPGVPDKSYSKRGGFIPTIDFNPLEFGMPPNTLEVTDVLQLLSLVVAKQTLADSGAAEAGWYDPSRTGVVLGVTGANALSQPLSARLQTPVLKEVVRSCGLSEQDADQIAEKFAAAFVPWEENSFPGMLGNVVSGRIANRFDFGGINCTLDAACASSLAAVRMAVSELASGRADLMLTGGCDAENTILMYLCFSKTPAFSGTDRIRPFDENSDGTLIGEGIGMLALKRLADAERDGDRIYGVLRGVGSSSDGRFKSIYAPRQEGQQVALRRAYADAKVGPDTVGLMECHGTGTAVGDLVELSALRDVYAAETEDKQFCAVGSVKSQIGHTKGAAGAAGLIKIALALHQKVLPPTINVENPREEVDFPNSPFYVNTESRPWIVDAARPVRRAALSSFGFGGTNFHCVVDEHDPAGAEARVLHRVPQIHVWYAADVAELLSAIERNPAGMADSADSAGGRHCRLAVVAADQQERDARRDAAVQRLREEPREAAFEMHGVHYAAGERSLGRIGALFAGQGSQYIGMGAATAMSTPPVRAELDAMSVASRSGSLAKSIFPPPAFDRETRDAQERVLRGTDVAQPAIGALSAGQFRFVHELGLRIEGALGHSFGELTALWASGALDDDAFRSLAVARGAAMAAPPPGGDADRGTMAAVRAAPEQLAELLEQHPDVVVCNLNTAEQTVVGGGTEEIRAFAEAADGAGLRAQPLPVSAAFHTRYVAHAVEEFREAVSAVGFQEPGITVYPNTEGAYYGADARSNRSVLVDQLVNPVAFAPRVRQMYEAGFRTFVEFGPKAVLSGLVRSVLADADEQVTVLSADPGPGGDGDFALKQLIARLFVLGCPLTDLNRYVAPAVAPEDDGRGMRVPLNGANQVSEERRRKYRDMIDNGYRIAAPEPATNDGLTPHNGDGRNTTHAEVNMHGASSAQPNVPDSASLSAATAHEHLSLHSEYLNNQLHVAERLSNVLAQHSENGVPSDNVVRGISAVSEHGIAIGRSHMQASEVLRAFAYLDAGAPVPGDPVADPRVDDELPRGHRPEITAGSGENGHEVTLGEGPAGQPRNGFAPDGRAALNAAAPEAPSFPPVPAPQARESSVAESARESSVAESARESSVAESARESSVAESTDSSAASVSGILLDIVAEKTGYPADMVELDMDLEADLGIDSIKRVEIMGALGERFPGQSMPPPEQLGEIRTLADVVSVLTGEGQDAAAEGVESPKADGASGIIRMPARLLPLPAADRLVGAYADRPVAVVVGEQDELADSLTAALRSENWVVHSGPRIPDELTEVDAVIDLTTREVSSWRESGDVLAGTLALAGRAQPLLEANVDRGRAAFVAVSRIDGALGMNEPGVANGLLGGLSGLVKTLAIEAPALFSRYVDVAPELSAHRAARLLVEELYDSECGMAQVGVDADGTRRTVSVGSGEVVGDHLETPRVGEPGPEDLLLVTGGARGVTAACAVGLAKRFRTGLLLVGRTPLAESEPQWARVVATEQLKAAIAAELRSGGQRPTPREVERVYRDLAAQREIRATVAAIREAGSTVEYLSLDITDGADVRRVLGDYADRITGVVHGAGVLADQLITDKSAEDVRRVLDAKLTGLSHVLDVAEPERLRHAVLFTSVAGFFGNRGQSDYAMANEALNRAAIALRTRVPAAHVTAVNWGAWAGGMVTPELRRMFEQRGVPLIPMDRGVDLFTEQLTAPRAKDVVCVIAPDTPLSSRETPPSRSDRALVRRSLQPLRADPVVTDHCLGGIPVLPATAAMGAMLNVVGRALPGREPVVLRGFSVLKGVAFDGADPESVDFDVTTGETTEVLVSDEQGRPRYRAGVADEVDPAPRWDGLPDIAAAEPVEVYGEALFHGPLLRGIRGVLRDDADELVLACRLPAPTFAAGACETTAYHPVLADLLLQAALVRVHRSMGEPSLPTSVGTVEVHAPIPDDHPFLIVVSDVEVHAPTIRCRVTACAPEGTVLLRMLDVNVVASTSLGGKFAAR